MEARRQAAQAERAAKARPAVPDVKAHPRACAQLERAEGGEGQPERADGEQWEEGEEGEGEGSKLLALQPAANLPVRAEFDAEWDPLSEPEGPRGLRRSASQLSCKKPQLSKTHPLLEAITAIVARPKKKGSFLFADFPPANASAREQALAM